MPTPSYPVPRIVNITLPTANTAYKLLALINTADSQYLNTRLGVVALLIQFDTDNAVGGKKLRIGNSDLTNTTGFVIYSTTNFPPVSLALPANVANLQDIYVMSDVDGATAAVCFVTQ